MGTKLMGIRRPDDATLRIQFHSGGELEEIEREAIFSII
jgi:hypothetical protein